jgi:hypothetical protein
VNGTKLTNTFGANIIHHHGELFFPLKENSEHPAISLSNGALSSGSFRVFKKDSHNPSSLLSNTAFFSSAFVREQSDTLSSQFGAICHHLLSILDHLFKDGSTLKELIDHNQLFSLLEILSIDCQNTDCDLTSLHKQLVRCICRLLDTSCRTFPSIVLLHEKVFFFSFIIFIKKIENLN